MIVSLDRGARALRRKAGRLNAGRVDVWCHLGHPRCAGGDAGQDSLAHGGHDYGARWRCSTVEPLRLIISKAGQAVTAGRRARHRCRGRFAVSAAQGSAAQARCKFDVAADPDAMSA